MVVTYEVAAKIVNFALASLPLLRTKAGFKMLAQKIVSAFWLWLKITLATFLLLLATILMLPPLLTILDVPSFIIGHGMVWLLRWQNQPGVRFAVSFNPLTLLAIASVIGLVGVGIWANRQRRDRRIGKKQSSRKTLISKGDRR